MYNILGAGENRLIERRILHILSLYMETISYSMLFYGYMFYWFLWVYYRYIAYTLHGKSTYSRIRVFIVRDIFSLLFFPFYVGTKLFIFN